MFERMRKTSTGANGKTRRTGQAGRGVDAHATGAIVMVSYPPPETANPIAETCTRCPALVASRECISWGNGSPDATLLVVGEAPGEGTPEADRWQGGNWTGMAYTARHSGRKVRELCADLGYSQKSLYFTNAVKCFPEGENGNREPTAAERTNCRPYLVQEIDAIEPEAVLATGSHATRSLLADEPVELDGFVDSILEPIEAESLGTTVLPVLHPSYQAVWLSRLGYTYEEYVGEIRQVLDALETP